MIEVDIEVKRKDFHLIVDEVISDGITGIYGKNGSGKTTLLHAIAGIVPSERGRISVGGRVIYDSVNKVNVPIHKRRVGYVFQEGRLFPHLSVSDNLRYGMNKKEGDASFDKMVDLLLLRSLLDKKPGEISGGEGQRVALGRSLLANPQALLLDEPFSAIDQDLKDQIIPYLTVLQEEWGIPFVIISHNLKDILKITDRLMITDNGRVRAHGLYYDLLLSGAVSTSDKVCNNVMEVEESDADNDFELTTLAVLEKQDIKIKISSRSLKSAQGKRRLLIPSNEISIALNEIQNTSIQNQIPGIVMDSSRIIDNHILMIDIGIPLAVTVSAESKNRLDLIPGTKVWCLIKASTLQVY